MDEPPLITALVFKSDTGCGLMVCPTEETAEGYNVAMKFIVMYRQEEIRRAISVY
jgi:hypothetical protein